MQETMANVGMSPYNVGTKVITSDGKIIFFELDKSSLFLSTNSVAQTLASFPDTKLCLYMSHIDNKLKPLILQLITKKLYRFTKYKSEYKSERESEREEYIH